jgi:hypothetical protein
MFNPIKVFQSSMMVRLYAALLCFALFLGIAPMSVLAESNNPGHVVLTSTAAPNSVSLSGLTWCFLVDTGTSGSIGQSDSFQVTGTLTNNTGIQNSFRIGVRLVNYSASTLNDFTFGGPSHLFGNSNAQNEATSATITDLNLMGAASGDNEDNRVSFGEVQNITPVANNGAQTFSVQLGVSKITEGTNLRAELYVYDTAPSSETPLASFVNSSIPYSTSGTNCLTSPATSSIDVGTGFSVTGAASGGNNKYSEGWLNIGKPAYTSSDGNIHFEFITLTESAQYEHDFDQTTAFIIDIYDITSTPTLARTITGNNPTSAKSGCNYTLSTSGGTTSVSLTCRKQIYYTNVSSTSGRTPATGGYTYSFLTTDPSMTHILTFPIGASNPWLVSGHLYEARMRAESGTGSHKLAAAVLDRFSYEYSPTSTTLVSFNARAVKKGVSVKWETGNEANILGFNVWRKNGKREWKKLNAEMIEAKEIGNINHGAKYNFLDTTAKPTRTYRYKLEIITTGATEWSEVVKNQ